MGNAQGPVQEGHIVSVPKTDNCPPERPYNGPPVFYYVIAAQDRDQLDPIVDEQYRKFCVNQQYEKGRHLLLFKKKPLSCFHFGIFREPTDVVDTLAPPPYSAAVRTGSCNSVGQFSGSADGMGVGTKHSRTPEKCATPLHSSDRYHPSHETSTESLRSKDRLCEASGSPHHISRAVGGSVDSAGSPRQQWQRGCVSVWLHGQHRQLPKDADGKKRDLWVADPLCLADALAYSFQNGERLVCLYMTTEEVLYQEKGIPSGVKVNPGITKTFWCQHQQELPFDQNKSCSAILVDLVLEIPLHQPQERYIYTVVAASTTIEHKRPDTGTMGHSLGLAVVNCNWEGTFHGYLQQGWRLVDVMVDFRPPVECVDSLAMTQFQYKYGSGDDETTVATWHPIDTQTLWIFEKPASRQHNPTPVYEGKMVSFAFKYTGNNPLVCWDDEIHSMGSRGWELACFVERANYWPIKESGSSDTETMVQSLLFFQRPINP